MKDRENEILCLIEIGIIKSTEGDHSKAIFTFEKAQEIIQQTKNKDFTSECIGRIGISYELTGDYEKAGKYYKRALNVSREMGNQAQEAIWLSHYGYNYKHLPDGNNITAIELTEQAKDIAKKTRNEKLSRICFEKYQMACE